MIIRITRSGGFAGISEEVSRVDTQTLSAEKQRQVDAQIGRLIDLAGESEERAAGADLLSYTVEVEDRTGERQEVVVVDDQDPGNEPLQLLTEILEAAGDPARGRV